MIALKAFTGFLAIAFASASQAQMTGSRLGQNATSDDAEAVLKNMVRCVGERQPEYARQIMVVLPGSKAEQEKFGGNLGDLAMCMEDQRRRLVIPGNVEMRLTARAFRLELAQVLAREALSEIDDAADLASASAWSPERYNAPNDLASADATQMGLYQFGDCVVAANPVQAAQVVRFGPESAEGGAAIQALIPFLAPCLREGVQLELTPATLGIALAEPIYFRARELAENESQGNR